MEPCSLSTINVFHENSDLRPTLYIENSDPRKNTCLTKFGMICLFLLSAQPQTGAHLE